jgi:hypothetical protein
VKLSGTLIDNINSYYFYIMIIEWLFTFLVVYLLYKLVFEFILPVSKATSQMRSKINQMNQQQQAQQNQQHTPHNSEAKTTARPPADDYIDFEEIK